MRALSLTQPWATAMALGIKEWETRSWPTGFRGRVAIHAAKGFPLYAREFAVEMHEEEKRVPLPSEMPLGCIVAVGNIVDCQPTENVLPRISSGEEDWGDYADGRFAFKFELEGMIIPVIPARGALGFWEVGDALETAIKGALVWQPRAKSVAG